MSLLKKIISARSVKNGVWLYLLQIFNTVIPLVTLPYVTRVLGASQYGAFSIVLNVVTYLQVLVEYGFALSATRKVALADENENLSKLYTQVLSARVVLLLIAYAVIGAYMMFSNKTLEENLCLLMLSICLAGYCLQMNWLFQGKQEMKFVSITNLVARTVSTIGIFVFVRKSSDLILYSFLYSISPVVSNILGVILAKNRYALKFVRIKVNDVLDALKDGAYVFMTQLSSKVFGAIGITFLGIYVTEAEVGIYSALYKIPYMMMLLWSPISQVIYPITSKRIMGSFSEGLHFINRIKKYCILIFSVISIFVAILAKPIALILFGVEYASHYYIVYPLLIWMLLGINNNFQGIQILVGSGHDAAYSKCFQIGVLATVLFNFVLVYFFGINGAAIAPALAEGFLCILLTVQVKKASMS